MRRFPIVLNGGWPSRTVSGESPTATGVPHPSIARAGLNHDFRFSQTGIAPIDSAFSRASVLNAASARVADQCGSYLFIAGRTADRLLRNHDSTAGPRNFTAPTIAPRIAIFRVAREQFRMRCTQQSCASLFFATQRIFLTNQLFKSPETGAAKDSRNIKKP
jgi:hypothetical protein